MKEFALVSAKQDRYGFTELVMRARLEFEELMALGELEQDPYSPGATLELWVDSPALNCTTRLDGPSGSDVLVTNEAYLYEIRALTRLAAPTEASVHQLLRDELARVLAAKHSKK